MTQNPSIPAPAPSQPWQRRGLMVKLDAFFSRLSSRSNFWHRVCSMVWLPLAFKSGIRMKQVESEDGGFAAELPFKRINRNWYSAMAGAALLGNAEIAGGMYLFKFCGGDYTVVCKKLEYSFLRPCVGPAVYKVEPRDDIKELIAKGGEFNTTLDLNIVQQIKKPGARERRVGRCVVTFHVTPKELHRKRRHMRKLRKLEAQAKDKAGADQK